MTELNKIYKIAFLQTKDVEILLEGTVHDETFKQKRKELRTLQTTSVATEFSAARARASTIAQEQDEAKAKRETKKRKAVEPAAKRQRTDGLRQEAW